MQKIPMEKIYGPKSTGDNSFAAKARFLQSWYRANKLNETEYGFGPDKSSDTKYGNILVDGETSGKNFLSTTIFNYAQYRLQFKKNGETIAPYRLFNNMLSSQPMCFNLFFPLKALFESKHLEAYKIVKACFPILNIAKIVAIEIEYLPYPPCEYLDDKTAFDAMIIYTTETGERNILAIETKYIEKLGSNPSSNTTKHIELVKNSLLFNEEGRKQAKTGFGQLGRNFLLAEKFRIENRLDKAYAVVISPVENNSSDEEIKVFHSMLNQEYHDRLFHLSLENMMERIKSVAPKSLNQWMDDFNNRYLGFASCDSTYKEYLKELKNV